MSLIHLFGNWDAAQVNILISRCKGTWFCSRIVYAALG